MRFRWAKAPTSDEFTQLTHNTIAQRVARFLERQGLLERNGKHSYLRRIQGKQARWINGWATRY
jgi:hypothetical protein